MRYLVSLTIAFTLTSCFSKSTDVTVSVTAKAPDGSPVAEAEVFIDKQLVGDTNAYGTFTYQFEGDQESRHRIEVKKSGESYYFAPHFETALIPKAKNFTWSVDAVMYMVPKPKPKTMVTDISGKPEEGVAPTSPSENPKNIFEETPFILNTKGHKTYVKIPEELSDALARNDLKEETSEQAQDSINLEGGFFFTLHTYTTGAPLDGTEVLSCSPQTNAVKLCESNARGRCAVRVKDIEDLNKGVLILRRSGYVTKQISGPFEKGSNLRHTLNPGKSVDFLASFNAYGAHSPAAKITFAVKDPLTTIESNVCGFASFQVPSTHSQSGPHKLTTSNDSVSRATQSILLESNGKNLPAVELKPSQLPAPHVFVAAPKSGANVTQVDASKYLSWINQERLVSELKASFEKAGIDANATPETATHRVHTVLIRDQDQLSLGLELRNSKSEIIKQAKRILGANEDDQKKAVLGVTEAIASSIIRGDAKAVEPASTQFEPSARWINVVSEPKYLGLTWANGTTRLEAQDSPVLVADTQTVQLESPPGYLPAEISLENQGKWIAWPVGKKIHLEKDYFTNALELIQTNRFDEALLELKLTPEGHSQYKDAIIARLVILSHQGKFDADLLKKILDLSHASSKEVLTDALNEISAEALLASQEILEKKERLEHAKRVLAASKDLLERPEAAQQDEIKKLVLVQQGIIKSVMATLDSDPVLAADSEADLKEYLKLTEADSTKAKTRYLRVLATKNLHSLERQ